MRNPPSANNVQDDEAECNKILQYSIKDYAASHLLKQVCSQPAFRSERKTVAVIMKQLPAQLLPQFTDILPHCLTAHINPRRSRREAAAKLCCRHFSLLLTAIRAILFFSRPGIRSEAQTADIQPASRSRKPGRFSLRHSFGYQGRHPALSQRSCSRISLLE